MSSPAKNGSPAKHKIETKEEDANKRPKTESKKRTLEERLKDGGVICAEGYLFALEHRGYVQIGSFVPEVVLDHPEVVEQLHREFLRAGSDVIEAFTYYAHREKMRLVQKEHLIEKINRDALAIAKKVAAEGNALVAGNVCNTNIYDPNDKKSIDDTRAMFEEQIKWAAEAGVDFVIGETFGFVGEAMLALEVIKEHKLPAAIMMAIQSNGKTRCGKTPAEACLELAKAGSLVVGLNCARGPATMLPLLKPIADVLPKGCYLAALPVPFRTTEEKPTFQSLCAPEKMYSELDPHTCTRYEMADFAVKAREAGCRYWGVCCGGSAHHIRSMAEALGRVPEGSKFSADLSKHFSFGTHKSLKEVNTTFKGW